MTIAAVELPAKSSSKYSIRHNCIIRSNDGVYNLQRCTGFTTAVPYMIITCVFLRCHDLLPAERFKYRKPSLLQRIPYRI